MAPEARGAKVVAALRANLLTCRGRNQAVSRQTAHEFVTETQ